MSEAWESEERDDHGRFSGGGGASGAVSEDQTRSVWSATVDQESTQNVIMKDAVTHYLQAPAPNVPLREGVTEYEEMSPLDQEQIVALDTAMIFSSPTAEATTLYRGIGAETPQVGDYEKMQPGDTFTEPGYPSTSTSEDTAKEFTKGEFFDGRLLQVEAPAGTQGLHIPSFGSDPYKEGEVLLERGSTFVVQQQLPDRTVVGLVPPPR